MSDTARQRFERATDVPLLVLSVAMIPLLAIPAIVDLPSGAASAFAVANAAIWMAFVADFVLRLALADHRLRFLRASWMDLLIIALPFLRPLRVASSARALRLVRLGWLATALERAGRTGARFLFRHRLHDALLAAAAGVLVASGLVYFVESDAKGTNITTIGDSLWWAVTTVTTVGYGDVYPVTAAGQVIATVVMLAGIALFGVLSANLASVLLEGDHPSSVDLAALDAKLDAILARLDALEAPRDDAGSAGRRA